MGNELSPRLREEIARFDPVLEQISVAEFCRRKGVSRASFYRVKNTVQTDGLAAALTARSRAPKQPAKVYGPFTVAAVRQAHADLVAEFKDAGPWSVEFRLFQLGVDPLPSRSTVARIMRSEGLTQPSPNRRPRSSYKRFRRAHANEMWQLDAMAWTLPGAEPVTVYQLIDDHSRLCPAVLARPGGETADGARDVLEAGFVAFGQPQTVLSDNSTAFNQHRRGRLSSTEVWLAQRGIRPLSGRIHHPQTQGKVERAHQSLLRWLEGHQPATLEEVHDLLERWQRWYNHERQHQALGQHSTPIAVWDGASKLGPEPQPIPLDLLYRQPLHQPPAPTKPRLADRRIGSNQTIKWRGIEIYFGSDMSGQLIHIIQDPYQLEVFDTNGELHAIIPWPPPGRWISAAQPPVRQVPVIDRRKTRPRSDDNHPSQMS